MSAQESEAGQDRAAAEREDERDFGRWLFSQECRFLTAAVKPDQLPELGLVEVAFAGRSNVGKSSLLNALVGRKALARTSNTPGRTRQLNFFGLGDRLVLVDLPGYGYARAAKSEIKSWTGLTRSYLRGRALLRRACLLIDSRHGIKDGDREIMTLLDQSAVSYQVVLTKADKPPAGSLPDLLARTEAELARRPAAFPTVLVTSAVKGIGIADLRGGLAALAAPSGEHMDKD